MANHSLVYVYEAKGMYSSKQFLAQYDELARAQNWRKNLLVWTLGQTECEAAYSVAKTGSIRYVQQKNNQTSTRLFKRHICTHSQHFLQMIRKMKENTKPNKHCRS